MTWAEFSALLVLATATSFTPGPNTTLSTALAANRGLRGAMHFVCAVPVGWGLLFTACAWGMGTLVMNQPWLRWGIVGIGCAYLLWLAGRLARTQHMTEASANRLNVGFAQGVALQFLNIKAWMLALSVVAGWVAGHADAGTRFWQTLPVMLFYAFTSNFTYAWIGAALRRWLAQGHRLLAFNRCMALALLGTSIWVLASAVRTLP